MTTQLESVRSAELTKRFTAVRKWCDDRGINQYAAFFSGADPAIAEHSTRMGYLWRAVSPRLKPSDVPWLKRCEAVVELFKNAA